MIVRALVVAAAALLGAACGETIVELDPLEQVDAAVEVDGAPCVAGDTQCTNCADDDADGQIDGFDVECTGAVDDDEGSFGTDVTGDNGGGTSQDCFFDGNSGFDDGCSRHVCCILDLDAQGCQDAGHDNNFDPAVDCATDPTAMCVEECSPLVPPGCDCFGCCNVCDGAACYDIYIHPALAPDCDADVLSDPDLCPRCVPITSCGTGCDGADDCSTSTDCGAGLFCSGGCCITVVE